MRQSTTSEVRLDQGKATSFGAAEAGNVTIWLPTGECDRISLRRASLKRKIAPNGFGIRGKSVYLSPDSRVPRPNARSPITRA